MPATTLDKVAITPCWRSFLGALSGALSAIDPAGYGLVELAGRTGFAFRINVHNEVCPSGPTAFPGGEIVRRAFDQVGWDLQYFAAAATDNVFALVQKRAIEGIEAGISRGMPSIAWGVAVPEHCLIRGFDSGQRRFAVSTVLGPEADSGGVAYGQLGLGPVPVLEVAVPIEKTAVDETRVAQEAIRMAVSHALGAEPRFPGYANGLAAYGLWMEALREGRAGVFGMAYNTQVYAESRRFAKEYLADLVAGDLLGSPGALAEAASNYEHVADNFAALAEMFPFDPGLPRDRKVTGDKSTEASALLERALFWEAAAVRKLQDVIREGAR